MGAGTRHASPALDAVALVAAEASLAAGWVWQSSVARRSRVLSAAGAGAWRKAEISANTVSGAKRAAGGATSEVSASGAQHIAAEEELQNYVTTHRGGGELRGAQGLAARAARYRLAHHGARPQRMVPGQRIRRGPRDVVNQYDARGGAQRV